MFRLYNDRKKKRAAVVRKVNQVIQEEQKKTKKQKKNGGGGGRICLAMSKFKPAQAAQVVQLFLQNNNTGTARS